MVATLARFGCHFGADLFLTIENAPRFSEGLGAHVGALKGHAGTLESHVGPPRAHVGALRCHVGAAPCLYNGWIMSVQ